MSGVKLIIETLLVGQFLFAWADGKSKHKGLTEVYRFICDSSSAQGSQRLMNELAKATPPNKLHFSMELLHNNKISAEIGVVS